MIKTDNADLIYKLTDVFTEKASYLSEIDGYIGDGDHGNNMKKGFIKACEKIPRTMKLSEAMNVLGMTLLDDIGGSMGPIYGTFFRKLSKSFRKDFIDERDILEGLTNALEAICNLAGAQVGDKTIIDTLDSAVQQLQDTVEEGKDLNTCMNALKKGAEEGWESTKNLEAKLGRAARLGKRSIGFYDAGATSCYLIIETLANHAILMNGL